MALRDLPSVDALTRGLTSDLPRSVLADIARSAIDDARRHISDGQEADAEELARSLAFRLERGRPTPVLNATGVLLHTNLGRAPLAPEAAEAARKAAEGYGNVEIDLETGARGSRDAYLAKLLTIITGAGAAMAVNNNAGALFLALAALAGSGSVPVSRGELIEIGGSYRLPELMAAAGCGLVEVGTTNRTRPSDYRSALSADTTLLLKVHPSNYRISGFSEDTDLESLRAIADEASLPLVFDAGSGLIDGRTPWLEGPPPAWLRDEPGVVQSLEAGADLVMFSGDKLFGGPQAGVLVGSADLIGRLRRHPIARAMRLDGPTLAALTVTAEAYADGRAGELPFWRMATARTDELERRCLEVISAAEIEAGVETVSSTVGAGSVPGAEVPSPAIVFDRAADARYLALLRNDPPVVARREAGKLIVDLRAIPTEADPIVAEALARACRS